MSGHGQIYMNDGREIHEYIEHEIRKGVIQILKEELSVVVSHESASIYGHGFIDVELWVGDDKINSSRATIYES